MSLNKRHVNASPEEVFNVLTDALAFGYWVVGPSKVVAVDPQWPSVGSAFVHQHLRGPLRIRDETRVLEIDPPRRLRLEFNLRPLGMRGEVTFSLEPDERGTDLVFIETVTGGLVGKRWNPVLDRLLWARNVQGLQRLKDLCEETSDRRPSSPDAPPSNRSSLEVAGGTAAALAFWSIAKLRGARAFHPNGSTFNGEVEVSVADDAPHAELFTQAGTYPARIRVSRGIGLPRPLPDVLGFALKIPDRYGPGADQDLLLASSGPSKVARRLLRPRAEPTGAWYSSILPFRAGSTDLLIGAEHVASAPDTFLLRFAEPAGDWHRFATVRVGEPTGEPTSFDPWHTGPDLVPSGILNQLRASAYQGSRGGRTASAPRSSADVPASTD